MSPDHSPEGQLLKRAFAPGKDCLSVEQLELCLRAEAASKLPGHLQSCAHCQAELELLRSFYSGPRDAAEEEAAAQIAKKMRMPQIARPVEQRSWWRDLLQARWLSPAAIAMAAVLLIAAVGLEWRRDAAPRIDAPNRPEDNVLRSGRLRLLAPSGDLSAAPSQIQWQPVSGAVKYEVRLLEVDRTQAWSDSTAGVQIEIPKAVQARIVSAKPFFVQVTAVDSGGRKLAESEPVKFRVLRKVYDR